MPILKPLARATLTKQAADTLRRFILAEGMKAGDALPSERELSEMLSVSRNIVREALTVLVAEGLIVKKPGSGIFVTEFDPAQLAAAFAFTVDYEGHNLAALSEARAALELGAVELMAARITGEQLDGLRRINQELNEKLQRQRSTIRDDIDFHSLLLQATHNEVLIELIPLLVEYFRLSVAHKPDIILRNPKRVADEHQRIIDGLAARDVAATRQALLEHLDPPGTTPWRRKTPAAA